MSHVERNARIVALAKAGRTYTSIAEQFGLCRPRVSQIAREAGVPLRRAGKPRRDGPVLGAIGFRNVERPTHIERPYGHDPLEEIVNSEEEGET